MSTTTAAASSAPAVGRWRRHRSSLLIVAALVLAVALVIFLGTGGEDRQARLDPANSRAAGAQAVAKVLAAQGVEVDVVRSADELDDAGVGADTTVVVTSADSLGESTVTRLREQTTDARLVVVDPRPGLLGLLGVDGPVDDLDTTDPIAAGCSDPRYADLSIDVDYATGLPGTTTCFGGALAISSVPGAPDAELVLLGADDLLTNDQITRAGNAALALRLLGEDDRLVWYIPDLSDLDGGDGVSLRSLAPDWIGPGIGLLAVSVIALMFWRGRRLGPLSTEPLPVAVKAIETTRSRGRLYRRAGDREHAAAALRAATRSRARERLGLGAGTDEATLIRDLARHLGRPEAAVADVVGSFGRPPATDREMIVLAADLNALEEEVRRT